jgi:hypothetical protein
MNVTEKAVAERELDADDTREFVAEEIDRLFGITVEDFVARVEAGEFEDHPAVSQLALLTGARLPRC